MNRLFFWTGTGVVFVLGVLCLVFIRHPSWKGFSSLCYACLLLTLMCIQIWNSQRGPRRSLGLSRLIFVSELLVILAFAVVQFIVFP